MPRPDYPTADRLDLVEVLHGREVADPYRWLEDAGSAATRAWSAAQDRLARGHLDALPGRERLASRLGELMATGSVSAPAWREGRALIEREIQGSAGNVLGLSRRDGAVTPTPSLPERYTDFSDFPAEAAVQGGSIADTASGGSAPTRTRRRPVVDEDEDEGDATDG